MLQMMKTRSLCKKDIFGVDEMDMSTIAFAITKWDDSPGSILVLVRTKSGQTAPDGWEV